MECQRQINQIRCCPTIKNCGKTFVGTKRFHFIEMFVNNSFYLFKQANLQNKMTLIKFRTEVVKSLLDYEKLSQIEGRGSNNAHYPKLIPASEKKKIPTLSFKRCYKNGQRHETRYQCVQCDGKPPLCIDPCFMFFHENQ